MEMKEKIEDKLKRAALSCGSFTAAFAAVTALFFVPYLNRYGGALVSAFMPLAFLLPFIALPLMYALIHRFSPLLFGRYHLFMPISALCAAVFFVAAFSSDGANAYSAAIVFFGMTLFASSLLIYRYTAFSVAARLGGDRVGKPRLSSVITAVVGGAAGVGTTYGFYRYDISTMYLNSAFVLAAAFVTVAFVGYLSTFNDVPKLGGKRVQSVKSVFASFFGGMDKSVYFSSLASVTAFTVISALSVAHTAYILSDEIAFAVCGCIVAAFALFYVAASKLVKRRSFGSVVCAAACLLASAALFGASVAVKNVALVLSAAAFCGAGGALAFRCACLRFSTVKPRMTSGILFALLSLTVCAAFAVALAANGICVVAGGAPHAYVYCFGFAAFAAAFGLLLAVPRFFDRGGREHMRENEDNDAPVAELGEENTQFDDNTPQKENV